MNYTQKILVGFVILCLSTQFTMAQINFAKGDWETIRQKAKKENKHIMVDAYTTWCGPCKWMSANVFTDPEVGKFFNAKYVSYKLDMEKGEGLDFASTYGIRAYPTIVYFSPNGEMVHKTVGAVEGEAFIAYGTDALDPSKQLYTLQKKYEAGNNEPTFLRNFALALQAAYEEDLVGEVANKYLASQSKDKWIEEENWEFIQQFTDSPDSEPFKYVMENEAKFREKHGDDGVDDLINRLVGNEMMKVIESQDEEALEAYKAKLKKTTPEDADAQIARLEYAFYSQNEEKSFKYAKIYLDKYAENWDELNQAAWTYFETTDDVTILNASLKWAEKSVEMDKNWYNTDTQANLLHKLGRHKEALKIAEESLKIGNEAGEDTTDTKKLVAKIKNALK